MTDWISVRERLPEEKKVVPVYHTEYGLCIGSCGWGKSKVWHIQPFKEESWKAPMSQRVTHWLPLPDLPEPEPLPVFCIGECAGFYPRHYVYHRDLGKEVATFPDKHKATITCDTLNKIWPQELGAQPPEPPRPEAPFCKDCAKWGWYDKGTVRNCYHHLKLTESTDSCGDFQVMILPESDI